MIILITVHYCSLLLVLPHLSNQLILESSKLRHQIISFLFFFFLHFSFFLLLFLLFFPFFCPHYCLAILSPLLALNTMHTTGSPFLNIGSSKRDLEEYIQVQVVYLGKNPGGGRGGNISQIEKLFRKLMEANKLVIKRVVSGNKNPIGETMRIREVHKPRLSQWRGENMQEGLSTLICKSLTQGSSKRILAPPTVLTSQGFCLHLSRNLRQKNIAANSWKLREFASVMKNIMSTKISKASQ